MIDRIPGTKNGFKIRDDTTNDDIQRIGNGYKEIKCFIVNGDTYKFFKPKPLKKNIVTINNKVKDREFYINSIN